LAELSSLLALVFNLATSVSMVTKPSHFEFDWWIVQKRAMHVVVILLATCLTASVVALYVWKFGNPLRGVAVKTTCLPAHGSSRLKVTCV
jgi:hypothetical protein